MTHGNTAADLLDQGHPCQICIHIKFRLLIIFRSRERLFGISLSAVIRLFSACDFDDRVYIHVPVRLFIENRIPERFCLSTGFCRIF